MARILIVDDAAFMRQVLKDIIIEMGHEICGEAATGAEGVKMYTHLKPDLVTMDITMPDMDGVTAVKHIKEKDQSAKIIMCSAMGQHKMILDALHAGAKDFIVKPLDRHRVMIAIINQLKK